MAFPKSLSFILFVGRMQSDQLRYRVVQQFEQSRDTGGVSGLHASFEHNQKGLPVGHPKSYLVVARAERSPDWAVPKKFKRTLQPMSKFEQRAVVRFFTLNGVCSHQIQTEFGDLSHEEAFQLPAVEKWQLGVGDGTKGTKYEPRSG
jgi:hypothetical protein